MKSYEFVCFISKYASISTRNAASPPKDGLAVFVCQRVCSILCIVRLSYLDVKKEFMII